MGELLGVRAAARALDVAPSTISRQIANGVIPNRGTEDEPKVDLEEARARRGTLLDPTRRPIEQDLAREDDDADDILDGDDAGRGENSEGARRAPAVADPEYVAARVEKAKIATKLAELEYQQKIGALIPKADVDAAMTDATRMLRDDLLRMPEKVALEVAASSDPVECTKIMRNALIEALGQLAARFGALKQ